MMTINAETIGYHSLPNNRLLVLCHKALFMKKIILAIDGTNFSDAAFEFARQLNEKAPILLAGIFVPQTDYANLWSYASAAATGPGYIPLIEEEENDQILKNIETFETQCQKNGIAYRVHKDFYDFVLPELKRESRFADLIILSGELFYHHVISANQFEYMRHVLHYAECPVLIVPENLRFPENNILAYDGGESSVYAIKQFSYLFPELSTNDTLLVYAEDDEEKDFPARDLITELATQHYKALTFYKAELNPGKYFGTWMANKKNAILVSGAFSRSVISQTFRKSFVFDVIMEHKVPVFIAHK
jgi:nucleotide-binding universal stress UspA family protein